MIYSIESRVRKEVYNIEREQIYVRRILKPERRKLSFNRIRSIERYYDGSCSKIGTGKGLGNFEIQDLFIELKIFTLISS